MRVLPAVLVALAIAATPVIWSLARSRLAPSHAPAPAATAAAELEELRAGLAALGARVAALEARPAPGPAPEPRRPAEEANAAASDSLQDAFAQVVLIADRRSANAGLSVASPAFLAGLLGPPREELTDVCSVATNARLTGLLATENVGPIEARLVQPALVSLRQVFANVQVFEPELYARIRSAGSLCVRRVRGSEDAASAHAYGLAVDINIDGMLDELADGKTQLGLILLADFFRKEGWIWGAGFSREDSMHFEVSREKLEQWRRLGLI
ncbi:M15 family metallopeptidase [Oceanicella sp. SM1341]|uniref:M15 family metallopeptidase n=1 Tax=Oceanicella sp. SM1341 TaxID=1548889 RepID=UPI000E4EA9B6|nr:M15 family metallopeptidase [Oceanicella sp. SM1341]